MNANRGRRALVAFAVAPLTTPLVLVGANAVIDPPRPLDVLFLLGQVAVTSTVALPVAYLTELLIGVPTWGVFSIYRVRSLYAYVLAGAAIGSLPAVLLPGTVSIPIFALAGAIAAVIFRVIVFSGRSAS